MSQSTILPPQRVAIVGVLNVTPDSFSDGGRFVRHARTLDLEAAVAAAHALARAGADWIDVGGESTRPGAETVAEAEEIARTRPLIEELHKHLRLPVCIDTRKAAVAEAALDAGARAVNDVSGFRCDPGMADLVARRKAGAFLGHMRGEPATMQREVRFEDAVEEVTAELEESLARARVAGVPDALLAVDPGIGFGKRLEHNLSLLANLGRLREALGLPVLVGPSRKSFLGQLTGDPVTERDTATHAACAVAVFAGADAIRVHDVSGARRVVQVCHALRLARSDPK